MSSTNKPIDCVRAGAMQAIWHKRIDNQSSLAQAPPNPHSQPHHLPPKPHNFLHSSKNNVTNDHNKPTDPNTKITKPAAAAAGVSERLRSRRSAGYIKSLSNRIALLEEEEEEEATAPDQLRQEAPKFKPETYPDLEEPQAGPKAFQPGSQETQHTSMFAQARGFVEQAAAAEEVAAAMDAGEMPIFVGEGEEEGGRELGPGEVMLGGTGEVLKVGNGSRGGDDGTAVQEKAGSELCVSVEMSVKEAEGAIGLDGGK